MTHYCRFCCAELTTSFADLGSTPLANSYLTAAMLTAPEQVYPLHARVCSECLLVQVESVVPPEHIFSDYAYFSSWSSSWLEHARRFTEQVITRFELNPKNRVVEIASNDGYLLTNFVKASIPCLGVEPAANVAAEAEKNGVPTKVAFFGRETAIALKIEGWQADLLVANNVLAHVPDLNDFVAGMAFLLAPKGLLSVEVPHLLKLIEEAQFDTIYHEHYCYFSLLALQRIFAAHGLEIFDVEELPTHGGSLRIFIAHRGSHPVMPNVSTILTQEQAAGLHTMEAYSGFGKKITQICHALSKFLDHAKSQNKTALAYGAAAKGNTLLNVSKISKDRIGYVVDKNPHKQGRFLPGSHLPIRLPADIFTTKPDYLLILPWNLKAEISAEMAGISEWGGQFVTAIPELRIWSTKG